MTTIEFLDAGQARDLGLSVPDIYYSRQYGVTAEFIDNGTWECAHDVATDIVYPYVRRPIPGSPGTNEYDIVSPYGYAGIAVPGGRPLAALERFRREFVDASRDRGLIAEFIRTNPFDADEAFVDAMGMDRVRVRRTYGIRFGRDPAQYWDNVEGRHRTAVRKAQRLGVKVARLPIVCTTNVASGFRQMYDTTMKRLSSRPELNLGHEYFRLLARDFADDATVFLAHRDGDACAAAIFLTWHGRVHYHLSGSTPEGRQIGATNLLLDAAARTLGRPGGLMHLGGSVSGGDDGLARFKRSLSTDEFQVYLCGKIVNAARYAELAKSAMPTHDAEYFPIYRATPVETGH